MRKTRISLRSMLRQGTDAYLVEASRDTMGGTLVLGSVVGYVRGAAFRPEEIIRHIHEINGEREAAARKTVACMVSESVLVGRSGESGYQEKVFNVRFSVSPRAQRIDRTTFYGVLLEYASALGGRLKQTRVYIDFEGKTVALKAKEKMTKRRQNRSI